VDIERNLRAPLAGVRAIADRDASPIIFASRRALGDTPPRDRHQLRREPPDILITTPESLYLMLTSQAREILFPVDTLIVDEIHSWWPTSADASLRLSGTTGDVALRGPPIAAAAATHRAIATQRPLEKSPGCWVARMRPASRESPRPRPVEIVEPAAGSSSNCGSSAGRGYGAPGRACDGLWPRRGRTDLAVYLAAIIRGWSS